MKDDKKFEIDFFELAFLAEACIPPSPIARAMFWDRLINEYFYQLNWDQRLKLYHWIGRNYAYTDGLEKEIEDILVFEARYNPDNQYIVKTTENTTVETFLFNGRYHTQINRFVSDDKVFDVIKLDKFLKS